LVVALLLAGSVWYYQDTYLSSSAPATPSLQTSRARLGNMTISLSGAGALVPASQVSIGFKTSGTVVELLVEVGDKVQAGDILARLEDDEAQMQLEQAQTSLRLAELKLAELDEEPDPAEVAEAKASLAVAQQNLEDLLAGPSAEQLAAAEANLAAAQEKYQELVAGPSAEQLASAKANLEKARLALQSAQATYVEVANDPEKAAAAAEAYQRAILDYEVAQANYDSLMQGPSGYELQNALAQINQARDNLEKLKADPTEAELAAAEAQVAQAQARLDSLLTGPSEVERETAALEVQKARNALQQAQWALDGTVLKAPISGTVTAVDTAVGQTVGTGPVITLSDLDHVQIRFYVDETDMGLLAVGQPVRVVFDALPEETFTGQVVRIEPGLKMVEGVPVATAWAELERPDAGASSQGAFMEEMTASVEVIAADRRDVVLVPMAAVREFGPGKHAVFVVGPDGKLTLREVEVGLCDNINYEIVRGLEPGEVVSTGIVDAGA